MENKYQNVVKRVGITTIIANIILCLAKVVTGILAHTSSLISDGIHSASDVFSTVVVMIGAKMSKKEPDKDHPFGHERIESVASILLAIILAFTGLMMGYSGILKVIEFIKGEIDNTEHGFIYLALAFSILSILVKGWMYFYTIKKAKAINSVGLKADAYHHLSDSLSSFASLAGIIGIMIGGKLIILDYVASIIICLFIIKVSFDIALEAFNQLVDKSAPDSFNKEIEELTKKVDGVISINSLKTRIFGNMYYVEIEIGVNSSLTVKEGHEIAESVHDLLEATYNNIKHCMVHIDPYEK